MRYRLRALLVAVAVVPPLLALAWWIIGQDQEAAGVVLLLAAIPGSVLYSVICVAIGVLSAVRRDRG